MNSGIYLIDKEEGITSFRSLAVIKKNVNKKTGHCGTLDSFASGLMIVLSGWCTKLVPLFMGMDKEYTAKIKFGIRTDTLDPEGKIIETGPVPSLEDIMIAMENFIGEVTQIPPRYSAVHVNGKRAYKSAMKGNDIEIPSRQVNFYSTEVLNYQKGILTVKTKVSKGTYIRSFARDLGIQCKTCAHLTELRRTSIGPFTVEEAIKAEDTVPQEDVLTVLKRAASFEVFRITEKELERYQYGVIPASIQGSSGNGLIMYNEILQGIVNLENMKSIVRVNQ